jgi:NAD+ synthase (glutamine-hydrolysing)
VPFVLSLINVQAPTAQLRPIAVNQTDEDDLMPYPVLDAMRSSAPRSAIRDKQAACCGFADELTALIDE